MSSGKRMRWRVFLFACVWGVLFSGVAAAQSLTSFETVNPFTGQDFVVSANVSTDWASDGSRSLRILHSAIPDGDRVWLQAMHDADWTGASSVQADFYVPEDAAAAYEVALVIQVGPNYSWTESDRVPLRPGENLNVTFDLTTSDWRSAATGWQPGATPTLQNIKAYGLLVFAAGGAEPGHLYADNFRVAGRTLAAPQRTPSVADRIRISGSAELTVTSEDVTTPLGDEIFPFSMAPEFWRVAQDNGNPPTDGSSLVGDVVEDIHGNRVNALRATINTGGLVIRHDLGNADLTGYDAVRIDVFALADTFTQIVMQSGADFSGWNEYTHGDVTGGQWDRLVIPLDQFNFEHPTEIRNLLIRFWGTGEFVVANVALIKSGDDSKVTTETILSRSHKVRLTLDYDLAPDWKASITGNFADPFAELGLVEVRGQAGPIGLRAFHNGTGGNLGDPLDMFKGSKYHENNTTGLEVSMPLGAGGAQAMALMPSKGEGDPLTVVNVKMPVGDLISAQAFAVNEWSDAEEGNMALGVAAEVGLLTGQRAVGEVVLGAGEDNLAWLAKASSPLGGLADIELSSRIVGENAMRRNDHTGGGAYGQHSLNLTVHLPSGWGPNVYAQYWHRPKGHWKDITGKVQVGGSIAGVNLTSYVQHKVRVENEGDDWKLVADESRLFARASASPFDWLSAAAILWLEGDQAKEAVFAVPTYLGRLGVKPLDGIELNLEAAMSKETADGDSVTNLYGKVTRQIQGGSLEFSYGKPTLNSNDDKRENLKTAEGYLQMKLNIAF